MHSISVLFLFVAAIPLSHACIPMKVPEPGIPALPACKKCPANLVQPDKAAFESDNTDNSGACSERSLVCTKNAVVYNGGIRFTSKTEGKIIFPMTCNADGTAWILDDSTITGPIQCVT